VLLRGQALLNLACISRTSKKTLTEFVAQITIYFDFLELLKATKNTLTPVVRSSANKTHAQSVGIRFWVNPCQSTKTSVKDKITQARTNPPTASVDATVRSLRLKMRTANAETMDMNDHQTVHRMMNKQGLIINFPHRQE
jgi:hypothetical protein